MCTMQDLASKTELFTKLWPSSRVVMGLRTCHWLRSHLLSSAAEVLFGGQQCAGQCIGRAQVLADFLRFQNHAVAFYVQVPGWTSPGREARGRSRGEAVPNAEDAGVDYGPGGDALASLTEFFRAMDCALSEENSGCLKSLDFGRRRRRRSRPRCRARLARNGVGGLLLLNEEGEGEGEEGDDEDNSDAELSPSTLLHMALHQLTFEDVRQPVLTESDFNALMTSIGRSHALAHLDLRGLHLGAGRVALLARAIQLCIPQLNHLDIGKNELGDEGIASIASALRRGTALQVLSLDENLCSAEGATSLAAELRCCTRLTHLSLHFNAVEDDGAVAVLQACSTLTFLDLSQNELTFEAAAELAGAIAACPSLRSLNLNDVDPQMGNAAWEGGMGPIGSAFPGCHALQRLELAGIGLEGPSGWLLPYLPTCTALTYLDLSGNLFGGDEEEMDQLEATAAEMPALTHMRIDRRE